MTAIKPVWESRKVPRNAIVTEPDFRSRQGPIDAVHVKTLVMAIRRGAKLPPVTLWQEDGRNNLVLLDGEHRLSAWATAGLKGAVPARVVSCSRRDALLIAAGANTRDALPLSSRERADLAWRLVRMTDVVISKAETARATGVSPRLVATMRARWRAMQRAGTEPNGVWWQDMRDEEGGDCGEIVRMTERQRRELVEKAATALRTAAGPLAFRDEDLFADALDLAFGRKLRAAIEYLWPADELDEWGSIEVQDGADDDDPDAPF